jgi:hypothetical protein
MPVNTASAARSAPPRALSPPQVAQRYGVKADKVLVWIRSGELRAVNVAARPMGRPRWRITEADLIVFESRRTAKPPPPATRRRRKQDDGVIPFF